MPAQPCQQLRGNSGPDRSRSGHAFLRVGHVEDLGLDVLGSRKPGRDERSLEEREGALGEQREAGDKNRAGDEHVLLAQGEPGVLVMFEETVPKYLDQAKSLGFNLDPFIQQGLLKVIYVRPLDLSMDETLYAIQSAVEECAARRVALDSISGLEAALAPAFKADFLESLYRLLGALTGVGITIMLTVEVSEPYNQMRFTPHPISFLTHDIVLQRYFEEKGELRSFMMVIKTRARRHSRDIRSYDVTSRGIVVGDRLENLAGIITATPEAGQQQD